MSVSSVAVVGVGPQGLSVVETFAQARFPVVAVQVTPNAGAGTAALRRLRRKVALRVDAGDLSAEKAKALLDRIHFARDLTAVRGADLVVESTVGDVRARRALMATLEGSISRGAVLASNAPPKLLTQMAEVLLRPDQFIGLRFLHPATHTPTVEVTPVPDTAPGVVAMCQHLLRWLHKTPGNGLEQANQTS
jgi:3-hydroxyacyl-CoA dehydrogenase